jgi:ribonuclease HII
MILAHTQYETNLWTSGLKTVAGIDEVGRGAWAGPMVIGAVIFPCNFSTKEKIADSKLLSAKKRNYLSEYIKNNALTWSVIEVSVDHLNENGLTAATQHGFNNVIKELKSEPDHILVDAFKIKDFPSAKQTAIIKGDQQSLSIAAASIIAKVYRDGIMHMIHQAVPQYSFNKNVGYGTKDHREALMKYGLCQYHRKRFNLERWYKNETKLA